MSVEGRDERAEMAEKLLGMLAEAMRLGARLRTGAAEEVALRDARPEDLEAHAAWLEATGADRRTSGTMRTLAELLRSSGVHSVGGWVLGSRGWTKGRSPDVPVEHWPAPEVGPELPHVLVARWPNIPPAERPGALRSALDQDVPSGAGRLCRFGAYGPAEVESMGHAGRVWTDELAARHGIAPERRAQLGATARAVAAGADVLAGEMRLLGCADVDALAEVLARG